MTVNARRFVPHESGDKYFDQYEGFKVGDTVIRPHSPRIGHIEHICQSKSWAIEGVYAFIRWERQGMRDGKRFDTRDHVPMGQGYFIHATAENVEAARMKWEHGLLRQAAVLGETTWA